MSAAGRRVSEWLYFGCRHEAGHYVFRENGRTDYWLEDGIGRFDGKLAPQPEAELYVAALSRLGGWGLSALSWWDRSVDRRPGSNSILFAPSLTIEPIEILVEGTKRFPWVFDRLPSGIRMLAQR